MSIVLKPDWKRYKKPAAVALSLVLHGVLFCALTLSSASNLSNLTLKGEGTSEVEGIELQLVGVHDSAKTQAGVLTVPPPAPDTQRMQSFMEMTDQTQAPDERSVATSQPAPAKSIAEALGENPFQSATKAAPAPKTADEAHVKVNDRNNRTANDLWKAIEPCWNRVADKNTLGVTLEVSFSPLGNLARPPVIKRSSSTNVNDRMLRSENQAITALSQCGPYLMAYGQEGVEIQFPGKQG